jgi:peptidoglycan/LPS O-acetylase OafA/YrhL
MISSPIVRATSTAPKIDLYFPFHTHSDGLACGVIIAWLLLHRPRFFARSTRFHAVLATTIIAVSLGLRTIDNRVFGFTALALIYGSSCILLLHLGSKTPPLLRAHWIYVLSRLSFGIYLNHFLFVEYVIPNLSTSLGSSSMAFAVTWLLCVSFSVVLATITFAVVELPFLQIRERVLKTRRVRRAVSLGVSTS